MWTAKAFEELLHYGPEDIPMPAFQAICEEILERPVNTTEQVHIVIAQCRALLIGATEFTETAAISPATAEPLDFCSLL
jgi:hypothetical protein